MSQIPVPKASVRHCRCLGLSGASIVTISENPTEQLLSFLSNPTVDGIILLIGIIAIALDFLHPTFFLSIVGAILVALGLIGAETIQSGGNAAALAVPIRVIRGCWCSDRTGSEDGTRVYAVWQE